MKGKLLFSETQSFGNTWAFYLNTAVAVAVTGFFGYGVFLQLVMGETWGSKPMPDSVLILLFCFMTLMVFGSSVFLYFLRLTVKVDEGAVYYRFPPFVRTERIIKKEEVKSLEVIRYSPIFEYGGWGSRGWSSNKAYNVAGKDGLKIHFHNGKKLLLGTQKKEVLKDAISQLKTNWGMNHG